jgi:3-oxoacyl-[acyl-carrier-protein] synthase II
MRRVVVTGMAGITSLGQTWEDIEKNLRAGASGVQRMPEWERYGDLLTRLGAPVLDFTLPPHYTRKTTRTMGRIAQMAVRARWRSRTLASRAILSSKPAASA